jgi:hypothetical protein
MEKLLSLVETASRAESLSGEWLLGALTAAYAVFGFERGGYACTYVLKGSGRMHFVPDAGSAEASARNARRHSEEYCQHPGTTSTENLQRPARSPPLPADG